MHLYVECLVDAPFPVVKAHFGEELFTFLTAQGGFPRPTVLYYEGNMPGAEVLIKLDFGLFSQHWLSIIERVKEDEGLYEFVDVGQRLPFFLSRWRHTHQLIAKGNQTLIVDRIDWQPAWWAPAFAVAPPLNAMFKARPALYQQFFHQLK